jgi:hypothetical protein
MDDCLFREFTGRLAIWKLKADSWFGFGGKDGLDRSYDYANR